MSGIISKIDSIDTLTFEPFTSKPIKMVKAVAVGTTIIALGENGRIYTNGVRARIAYCGGHEGALSRVLDGCIKLKVLTAKAVDSHKKAMQARQDKRDRKWSAERMLEAAEKLGVELSESQLKIVDEAKGGAA